MNVRESIKYPQFAYITNVQINKMKLTTIKRLLIRNGKLSSCMMFPRHFLTIRLIYLALTDVYKLIQFYTENSQD